MLAFCFAILLAADAWQPLPATQPGGILGERLTSWREVRLWRIVKDPFLLKGFESPPGEHTWQGEHAGKWLHAATLAYEANHDPALLRALQDTARRLAATQQDNGYIGTYALQFRFFAPPGAHSRSSWDVWTARYVLYGLLAYERFHPDSGLVQACVRLGDLLLATFGPGKADLTTVGTRHGMSSTVLLESVMMLYERTREKRFLDFAAHIHEVTEANPELRLATALSSGADVSLPGDGKAYQLMSNLLGYGMLYRQTGRPQYLDAVARAWDDIAREHTYSTGGPWSYKSDSVKNNECFATPEYFLPTNYVETCSTTTWVQLSLELLKLTGQAKYGEEAERAVLNHLIGAQHPGGRDWAYYTSANTAKRDYNNVIHCCGSSGPRALEVYARHLIGVAGDTLSFNSYLPLKAAVAAPRLPVTGVTIEGRYPLEDHATIRLQLKKPARFAVDFRPDVQITIRGAKQRLDRLPSGFLRLTRTWKPDEALDLHFDFPLRAGIQRARDGRDWVAFTRGPLALAEAGADDSELPRPADGNAWLEPAGQWFRVKGTSIVLMPYFQAGADGGPVRTYFPLR